MKIYEIGGIDNSGKTTQIKSLIETLGKHNTFIPPSLVEYSQIFPRTLEQREKWYEDGSIEEIITATVKGLTARYEDILQKNKEYTLLDRGWLTLVASNIARVMYRENLDYNQSKEKVLTLWKKYDDKRIESYSIILAFKENSISTSEFRENKHYDAGFKKYLEYFDYTLKKMSSECNSVQIIDASKNKQEISDIILKIIQK